MIRDGFPGQQMTVLPRPLVARAQAVAPTSQLLVTDAGHFPRAASHGRIRRRGAPEAVIIVCVEGRGWCTRPDDAVPGSSGGLSVRAGEALLIGPRVPHLYRADADDPWTIWWLHLTGLCVPGWMEQLGAQEAASVVRLHDPVRSAELAKAAVGALGRDETVDSLVAAAAHGWQLLASLLHDSRHREPGAVEPVRVVQQHLRDHLAEPVTVPELAELVGLSTSHLQAIFRRAVGTGPVAYLRSLRMARGRELLLLTRLPIAEVARRVGYRDQFYFSRHFSAAHGCSPTSYRTQLHSEHLHPEQKPEDGR